MDASKPQSPMPQTERQWKQKLTRQQFHVLRQKGTERPFTGKYDHFFEEGIYKCAGCGNVLFSSDAKYNSGCGWPAFSAPADKEAVAERRDTTLGMVRTEIYCPRCGGHLGHVFNDGPAPTGQRYCINSAALDFEQKDSKTEPRQ
ncbi:MAG: peptide-methionine (R)-S-oxide reductase MsrB [Planctomycetota bacterium]